MSAAFSPPPRHTRVAVSIPVESIVVPEGRRADAKRAQDLADSIGEVDLLNPITVAEVGTRTFQVIAGVHRLAAYRILQREDIPAFVVTLDSLRQRLATLDENLMRGVLKGLPLSEALAERKALWEDLHPETKHGGAPGKAGGGKARKGKRVSSFADDTAKKTGKTPRAVRQALEPAEKLTAKAKDAIADTPVAESGRQLRELAKESPENQEAIAEVLAKGKADTVAQAKKLATPAEEPKGETPKRALVKKRVNALRDAVNEVLGPLQKASEGIGSAMRRLGVVDADLIAGASPITLAEILGERLEVVRVDKGTVADPNLTYESEVVKKFVQIIRGKLPHGECPNCSGEMVCPGEKCLEPLPGPKSCVCGGAGLRCYLCKGLGFITKRAFSELKHNNPRFAG